MLLPEIGRKSALYLPVERQVKLHFIEPRRAAEKLPEKGSAPGPRMGTSLPRPPTGAFAPWTPSSFRKRQVCYDKDVTLPRMCTYAV